MVEHNFGHRFHDLSYFKVGFFFMFLEFIIHFKASSQDFVENYRSTIAGLSKTISKNKNYKIIKFWRQEKNRINFFCNILLLLSYLRSIWMNFLLQNKNWEIQFLRGEPYFSKKKNRSPGGKHVMVLQYQFDVILLYYKKKKEKKNNHLFKITYLHTTCTIFYNM